MFYMIIIYIIGRAPGDEAALRDEDLEEGQGADRQHPEVHAE